MAFCPHCGKALPKNASFCYACGLPLESEKLSAIHHDQTATLQSQSDLPPCRTINTIAEMEGYIEELSVRANDSVGAALKAQLQVIRYIQSPKLYDSSFDLFFQSIKKALRYAETPVMQDAIRERAAIMIQNYVFFMYAKLQFEIKVNRDHERQLIEDASKMLAQSIADVAQLATSMQSANKSVNRAVVSEVVIKNFFSSVDTDKNENLVTKFYRWWAQERITQQKTGEFLETIDQLTMKLHKQRTVIGESDLVAGLIRRYAEDMANYFYGGEIESATSAITKEKRQAEVRGGCAWGGVFVISVIWFIIRIIHKVILYGTVNTWFAADSTVDTSWLWKHWVYTLIVGLVAYGIMQINDKKELQSQLDEAIKKRDDLYQNYMKIAEEFDE